MDTSRTQQHILRVEAGEDIRNEIIKNISREDGSNLRNDIENSHLHLVSSQEQENPNTQVMDLFSDNKSIKN